MKTKYKDVTKNFISLSGEIDEDYTIPPGRKVLLEDDATFKGVSVGGQLLYNNEYIVKVFSLSASGEIELIPIDEAELELSSTSASSLYLTGVEQEIDITKSKDTESLLLPIATNTIYSTLVDLNDREQESLPSTAIPIPLTRSETTVPVGHPLELWGLTYLEQSPSLSPKSVEKGSSSPAISTLHKQLSTFWIEQDDQIGTILSPAAGLLDRSDTPVPITKINHQETFSTSESISKNSSTESTIQLYDEEIQVAGDSQELIVKEHFCGCLIS